MGIVTVEVDSRSIDSACTDRMPVTAAAAWVHIEGFSVGRFAPMNSRGAHIDQASTARGIDELSSWSQRARRRSRASGSAGGKSEHVWLVDDVLPLRGRNRKASTLVFGGMQTLRQVADAASDDD